MSGMSCYPSCCTFGVEPTRTLLTLPVLSTAASYLHGGGHQGHFSKEERGDPLHDAQPKVCRM